MMSISMSMDLQKEKRCDDNQQWENCYEMMKNRLTSSQSQRSSLDNSYFPNTRHSPRNQYEQTQKTSFNRTLNSPDDEDSFLGHLS